MKNGNPHTLLGAMYSGVAAVESSWHLLKELNIELPYDPEIPFLAISPEKWKHMFTQKLVHECECL